MIKENIKVVYNPKKYVTRICDGCNREDILKLSSIWYTRNVRKRKLDLCRSCSIKNEFLEKPRKNRVKYFRTDINEKNPLWKGGIDASTGYKKRNNGKGKNMWEHRLFMSEKMGRDLNTEETVHHIDLDKLNNVIDNLYLYPSKKDHRKAHNTLEKCGLHFLGSKVWFNYKKNIYSMKKFLSIKNNIDISDLLKEKIYYTTDKRSGLKYAFHLIRIASNKWKYKRFHVLISEKIIGRKLARDECVHHINFDTLCNEPYNLKVMTTMEHSICHHSLELCALELYKNGLIGFNKNSGEYFVF